MARAAFALSSPHRFRNVIAALANELDAVICVWVNVPLTARRTHKCSVYTAALEARLASFQMLARRQPPNTS
jgi:hypothetical protein